MLDRRPVGDERMTLIELFIILFTLIGIVVGVVAFFNYGLASAALGAISGGGLGYLLGGLGAILAIFVAHLVLKVQIFCNYYYLIVILCVNLSL
jgi:hypothetical protein